MNLEDIESAGDSDSEMEQEVQHHEPQSFVRYPTLLDLTEAWHTHQVLSAVMVDQDIFCCFRYCAKSLLIKMEVEVDTMEFFCSMWYHSIVPQSQEPENSTLELSEVVVTRYALLLPLKNPLNTGEKHYTIITSDWRSWNRHIRVKRPDEFFSRIDERET